jgi:hypothetical protein
MAKRARASSLGAFLGGMASGTRRLMSQLASHLGLCGPGFARGHPYMLTPVRFGGSPRRRRAYLEKPPIVASSIGVTSQRPNRPPGRHLRWPLRHDETVPPVGHSPGTGRRTHSARGPLLADSTGHFASLDAPRCCGSCELSAGSKRPLHAHVRRCRGRETDSRGRSG